MEMWLQVWWIKSSIQLFLFAQALNFLRAHSVLRSMPHMLKTMASVVVLFPAHQAKGQQETSLRTYMKWLSVHIFSYHICFGSKGVVFKMWHTKIYSCLTTKHPWLQPKRTYNSQSYRPEPYRLSSSRPSHIPHCNLFLELRRMPSGF